MQTVAEPISQSRTFIQSIRLPLLAILLVVVVYLIASIAYTTIRDPQVLAIDEMPINGILVNIDDRDMYLRAQGVENTGVTVVLVPGFGELYPDSGMWVTVQDRLVRNGIRVYAFDYAGFAWSDAPSHAGSHQAAADDLHSVLRTIREDNIILVSMGSGSNTALAYSNRYPTAPNIVGMVWVDADVLLPETIDFYVSQHQAFNTTLSHGLTSMGVLGQFAETFAVNSDERRIREYLNDERGFDWDYYTPISNTRSTRKVLHAFLNLQAQYRSDLEAVAQLPIPTNFPISVIQTDWMQQASASNSAVSDLLMEQGDNMQAWYEVIADNSNGQYLLLEDTTQLILLDSPQRIVNVILELQARSLDPTLDPL